MHSGGVCGVEPTAWLCDGMGVERCAEAALLSTQGLMRAHHCCAELITAPVQVQKISGCTAVACGAEFTMWLCDGKVWSAGGSQYGQLGPRH